MDLIVRLSDWLYLLLNGLAGRSGLADTLITLPTIATTSSTDWRRMASSSE